ncbi:MAG TPA: ATP-binding protein [Polyangiaceae bacterium]|nr:ATP-binding protein [Polyangiaceae bacterium]
MSCKLSRELFESAEAVGIGRLALTRGSVADAERWADPANDLDWSEFAALFNELERLCNGEPERIRAVGRALAGAPSQTFLRRLARGVVPLRRLYQAGAEWAAPAQFPHLRLDLSYLGDTGLRVRTAVPAPYAPAKAMFYHFEGVLEQLPCTLGLPRARLVESRVTERDMDSLFELPPSSTALERLADLARRARGAASPGDVAAAYEAQRRELTAGLDAMRTETLEIKRLFADLPDLVLVHRGGSILWMNPALIEALGYADGAALVGRPVLEIVAEDFRANVAQRLDGSAEGPPPRLTELCLLGRDGRAFEVEVSPGRDVVFGGAPARLVVARDITERARLRERVAVSDRMASIGVLAAGVAHEVNNPLGYVLNNIELADRELAALGDSPATRASREALAVALEGVDRIRTIVRELVALSRVDEAISTPVDLREVVESTLALAGPELEARATVVRRFEPVPAVRGSRARVGQLILNLVLHASEAMAEAPRAECELLVRLHPSPEGDAVIEVSDSGPSLSAEDARRVFEPFFAPGGDRPSRRGAGLGLAVAWRLVHDVGGELTHSPRAPRGSTYRVTLPRA